MARELVEKTLFMHLLCDAGVLATIDDIHFLLSDENVKV